MARFRRRRGGQARPGAPAAQPELAWPPLRPVLPGRARLPRDEVAPSRLPEPAPLHEPAPEPLPDPDSEFRRVPARAAREPEPTRPLLVPDDGWSAAASAQLEDEAGERLLVHLAAATGSRPGRAWSATTARLLQDPDVERALQVLLLRLGDCPGAPDAVSESNADVARAAVWAGAESGGTWVSPVLFAVGRRGLAAAEGGYASEKVLNATAQALGRLADDDAVHALQALALTARQGGHRSRLVAAIEAAAERRGEPAGDLLEGVVPTHGLDADGRVTLVSGGTRATAALEDGGALTVEWEGGGAKPPPGAPSAEVSAVRRQVRVLRTAVADEARRVEGLLGTGRTWDDEEWSATYLDHPLVSRVSRHVLWRFGDVAALPWDRDQVLGLSGLLARPPGPVTLWDPRTAPAHEVEAWRSALAARGVTQPLAQV